MGSVLIVDDAGFVRKILMNILEDLDVDAIAEAVTGEQAIERCAEHAPDVIFMDLVLPGKNGAETTAEILKRWPTVKIIAMSSAEEDWVKARAFSAGCVEFVSKPFTRDSIRRALANHLPAKKESKHG